MTAACWDELGIGATDDLVAIRRAYSARLKEIDADQDREGFIRLRESYDLARAEAAHRLEPAYDAPPPPEPVNEAAAPAMEAAPDFDGTATVIAPQHDTQLFQRIDAILFSDRPAEPGDSAELRALTEQMLSQPRMELIEHARDIEGWLAGAIAHSDPRGDAMLEPAIARFGWDRDSARWDEHPIIVHLVERQKGAEMIARLAQPDSHFHRAYLELTSADGKISTRGGRDWQVLDLINMIRAEAPYAETRLSPDRLQLWIDHFNRNGRPAPPLSEGLSGISLWWLVLPLVIFLPVFCQQRTPPPVQRFSPPSPSYPSPPVAPVPEMPVKSEAAPLPTPTSKADRLRRAEEALRRDGRRSDSSE
jgi:hypothetical protein